MLRHNICIKNQNTLQTAYLTIIINGKNIQKHAQYSTTTENEAQQSGKITNSDAIRIAKCEDGNKFPFEQLIICYTEHKLDLDHKHNNNNYKPLVLMHRIHFLM